MCLECMCSGLNLVVQTSACTIIAVVWLMSHLKMSQTLTENSFFLTLISNSSSTSFFPRFPRNFVPCVSVSATAAEERVMLPL